MVGESYEVVNSLLSGKASPTAGQSFREQLLFASQLFHFAKALAASIASLTSASPCLRGQQAGHGLAAACCRHPRAGLAPLAC